MTCGQSLQVEAYVDGELDALSAAAIEKHLNSCGECARLRDELEELRSSIRRSARYYRANAALKRQIQTSLGPPSLTREPGRRPFWIGAASGAGAMALAASLIVAVMLPGAQDEIANDVVSAHLRSLMGAHLIDVESNNHHVVKPWFAGRTDVSPPVADFAGQGFVLVGGRVDYVHGERAAVLVYRHGAHIANVFVWKDGAPRAGEKTLNGYHLLSWRSGNLSFCAISDMANDELEKLSMLIRRNSSS